MTERTSKRWWKRPVTLVAGGVLLLVLLLAGAEIWIGIKIRRTIEREAAALTGGICRVEVRHARFNLFNRSVRLRGITLSTDSTALAAKGTPLESLRIELEQLFVKGIRWENSRGDRSLSLGELTLQSPVVRLVRNSDYRRPDQDSTAPKSKRNAREQLAAFAGQIAIGRFALTGGTFDYCELRNGKRLCHGIDGITLQTDHLGLDASSSDPEHDFLSGDFHTTIGGITYLLDDGNIKLEIDSLGVDTKTGGLSLRGIRLLPQLPKSDFAALTRNHTDWTQAVAAAVDCNGVDFAALLNDKSLKIDSVAVRNVILGSYKNRQVPQRQRIKPLFYESLHKLSWDVDIRRIRFDSLDVTYQELSPTGTTPGTITFNELNGDFFGLTNRPRNGRTSFTIEAQGKLMNRGRMQATFTLPVDSTDNDFTVTGRLGPLNAEALNPITEPLTNLYIDNGRINGMNFSIAGNAMQSSVTLELRYDSLNVAWMKNENGRLQERKFLSAVLDGLVLKHSNPDSQGMRTGSGTTERDQYRSQFNYLWKSLLPGVKSTLMGRDRTRHRDKKHHSPDRLYLIFSPDRIILQFIFLSLIIRRFFRLTYRFHFQTIHHIH